METLQLDYPAGTPASGRALAGVVSSGDLEVLIEPAPAGLSRVMITSATRVGSARWHALLDRLFTDPAQPAMLVEIHDFGATPGVVSLRLAQALEALEAAP
ncbi:malonate decarboxylase subunit delta [Vogesella sp. LIG4]|uniref:malonate decarboxylase subunit delta n=1 Tax=Vogesella sp. LIG4 TaxID=1192162 RepID=UPI00081FDEB3|nr:malonate decarboxylase subunit delta [Vogesella sp. LIG4]SCK24430.1 malonate decarboxylase delta subunit [Vogesella sp. LIG4]